VRANKLEAAWWNEVLAGETGVPHPVYGDQVKVRFTDGRLILSGELDSRRDREELVRQARARIGNVVHDVEASRLRYRERPEKRGVLDQTLLASYRHRDAADLALQYVLEHSRVEPKHAEIVDPKNPSRLHELAPAFAAEAEKRLARGEPILVIRVDEVDAFTVRALLEEGTRSTWTVAAPPELAATERAA
jgi:hypothetical protein